jgi:nucleoside 2-deoxyribosyltransferase
MGNFKNAKEPDGNFFDTATRQTKIYFAAPLFNEMELARNIYETKRLEFLGFQVYLPQRDGEENTPYPWGDETKQKVFLKDTEAIKACDILIAWLDGAHIDEGVAFELGYAFGLKKQIKLISSDSRSFGEEGKYNLMITGPTQGKVYDSLDAMLKDMGIEETR